MSASTATRSQKILVVAGLWVVIVIAFLVLSLSALPKDALQVDPLLLYESSAGLASETKVVTWPYQDPVTQKVLLMASEPVTPLGEPYVVRLFDRFKCDGARLFVDVGLNTGFYSLLARARGCNVIAFEIQPSCIELFRIAERQNAIQPPTPVVNRPVKEADGQPFQLALGKCEGMFSLFWQGTTKTTTVALDTVLLPALDSAGTRISLLKIDIEGFEACAVAGARRLIAERRVDAIIVEATWWPNVLWPIHKAYSHVAMVFAHGYTVRCVGGPEVWEAVFTDAEQWMQYGKAASAMVKIGPDDDRDVSSCYDFFICINPCPFDVSPL
jgi:FkbM family methyltransferase